VNTWSPVVYGRTYQVDEWWRALPAVNFASGWLGEAVLAAVAGGNGLVRYPDEPGATAENTPRFILARGTDGTLVGLSCRARALSDELCQDRHGREIYCFTGWFTADPIARDIPELGEFKPRPDSWAAAAYVHYSAPVWRATAVSVQKSVPGEAPWGQPQREFRQHGQADRLQVPAQQAQLYPSVMAAQLWRDGIETPRPFVLVTGWQVARHASLEQITHVCADDITKFTTVDRRLPPAETVPGKVKKRSREKPDRIQADSRLHLNSTRLVREARVAHERAKHQDDQDGSSWPERVVHWLGQLMGGQPEPEPGRWPHKQPQQEQQPRRESPTTAPNPAAANTEAGAGASPEPRTVEIQLPKRQEAAEPFEGLE